MGDATKPQDGSVQAPTAQRKRGAFIARVAENRPLCREHFLLRLQLNSFPPTRPGQFVQVACRRPNGDDGEYPPLASASPTAGARNGRFADKGLATDPDFCAPAAFLRRPFSLAGRKDVRSGVEMDLIHRVVGVATNYLAGLRPGDPVSLLGPLGNAFSLPTAGQQAILVGGGVGIPPMLYLAEALGLARIKAVALAGALSHDLLPLTLKSSLPAIKECAGEIDLRDDVEEFSRNGITAILSTDDGSLGFRGYVTQALERYLDRLEITPGASLPPVLYTCGPEPMMKRVAAIAAARGLEAQVAVERAMACGMGTCQSCCIRVKKPDPAKPPLAGRDWCYRLACTDGPIFRGADLLW